MVTLSGYTLTEPDQHNYNLVIPNTVRATIRSANLPVTGMNALSKVYDGNTATTLTGSASIAPLPGDTVTLQGHAVAHFADLHVGTGKAIEVKGYTLSSADAANYSLVQPAHLVANITPKPLTMTAQAASKTYGDADAALPYTSSGLIHGDVLNGTLARAAGENVGSYAITQSDLAHSNYDIAFTGNTLSIVPKALVVMAQRAHKQQGQNLHLAGTEFVAHGLVRGERIHRVQLQSTGTSADALPGAHTIVASHAQGMQGFDADNYAIHYVNGVLEVSSLDPSTSPFAGQPATPLKQSPSLKPSSPLTHTEHAWCEPSRCVSTDASPGQANLCLAQCWPTSLFEKTDVRLY